ncbi:amidohydrolase family protein [Arthrobacter sp. L77]|uniref:amidohydrolase family protein n=1 Tax=Arthrobacter sp. L77 TaxID=1496689 RepID=UPI0009E240F0|nr:amidohydrolase family protein [Arthrobacter sp. L77]
MKHLEIIDSHVHVGTAGVPLGPPDYRKSFDLWVTRAATVGVHRAVLLAAPVGTYAAANSVVANLVEGAPTKWLWYVFVNAARDRDGIHEIVRVAHSRGACGIKVHWSDGVATDEVAHAAFHHHMPVLFDPGGDIDIVAYLARRHPEVSWIVPHLSSFSDDWRAQVRLISLLEHSSNVFTDTAGVRYFDLLVEAVARAGAHKVLFGSDGPYLHPAPELAKIHALLLCPEDRELVLRGNVLRLTREARQPFRRSHAHPLRALPGHPARRW